MSDEDYMKLAIAAAKKAEQEGGLASGAIVVNTNGDVVATGIAQVEPNHDPTAHGESVAIRSACAKLQSTDLVGCKMYGTLEPCNMCLSAALWANLDKAYFGAYASDVSDNKYEYRQYSAEERALNSRKWDGEPIKVQGGILRQECKELLSNYKNWQKVSG